MDNNLYKIGVIGAGAIGGIVAAFLTLKGYDTEIACKYADTAALCKNGLKISGAHGDMTVSLKAVQSAAEFSCKKDALLIAVKAYDLIPAAEESLPFLKEGGLVLSMQNGICLDALGERIGFDKAVGNVITYSATQTGRGHMELTGDGGLIIGFKDGSVTPALQRLCSVLNEAFPSRISGNITGELYTKLIINSCIGSLGVLTGMALGAEMKLKRARRAFAAIVKEALSVADAAGLKPGKFGGRLDYYSFVKGNGFFARLKRDIIMRAVGRNYRGLISSSYQSYLRGRPTEIDYLNGYIQREARKRNIPVPVNDKVIALVKEIEAGKRKPGAGNLREL